jgi:hypothetical protein
MIHLLLSCSYIILTSLLFDAPCAAVMLSLVWKAAKKIHGSLHSKEYYQEDRIISKKEGVWDKIKNKINLGHKSDFVYCLQKNLE